MFNVSLPIDVVVQNVRQAYFNLLQARRLVGVADAALARSELNLRSAQGFFDVGTKPKSDVTRAEVEVAYLLLRVSDYLEDHPTMEPSRKVTMLELWADVLGGTRGVSNLSDTLGSIEDDSPQLNGPTRQVLSLTSGTKFWRVRSFQGEASPTTSAVTDWSATGTFTVSSAPPVPVSVTLAKDPLYSGETVWVAVQLTAAAPSGGATINMSSSNPSAVPVPATITMPGNTAWMQFQVQTEQVTGPTPVTLGRMLMS